MSKRLVLDQELNERIERNLKEAWEELHGSEEPDGGREDIIEAPGDGPGALVGNQGGAGSPDPDEQTVGAEADG